MNTTTIYRINETDRTIEVAQFIENTEDSLHSAVLNTKTLTFDELMNQHQIFSEHTDILDGFRDRLHSALRIGRSIDIQTDDMTGRFTAEYGENIFFRGFVTAVVELYDTEREVLLKPNDVILAKLNKNKTQQEISERINSLFDTQLNMMTSKAYFDYTVTMNIFEIQPSKTIIAADDYTYHVFRESDNCLVMFLTEIGQIVHRNKWKSCQCGFCRKNFLGTEDSVCCSSKICRDEQEQLKKKNIAEYAYEYSKVKRDYDTYVRQLVKELRTAEIDKFYPDEFDRFKEAQEVRKADMDKLKKHLIRSDLPVRELEERGMRYRKEMKGLAEEILEKYKNAVIQANYLTKHR